MPLTEAETKDARARLRAKHGKAALAMFAPSRDEHGSWFVLYHPTRESAVDYCDLSIQMGWTDCRTIQTRDGGWANVYRWHLTEWKDGDPNATDPRDRGMSRTIL